MTAYKKLNRAEIPVESVPDEHDVSKDFMPSFLWEGKRYFLKDFIKVHNNPWVEDIYPDFIHGYEQGNYYNPLYIEVKSSAVNVYAAAEEKGGRYGMGTAV